MSYKPITVKFNETLYKQINEHALSNSEMIRKSCMLFLQLEQQNINIDEFFTTHNQKKHGNTAINTISNTDNMNRKTLGITDSNTGKTHGNTDIQTNSYDDDDIPEHIYSQMYGELYNIEVLPLKNEIQYLTQINEMLNTDKRFLQEQNNALILAKNPLLTRLKLALLPSKK
jgi:hypothetical protein